LDFLQNLHSLPTIVRISLILFIAIIAQFVVHGLRRLSQWLLIPHRTITLSAQESLVRRFPRIATLMTILVSAVTFLIYFVAIGLVLKEFNVSLTAYIASASIIGLAVGFGLQGLVQDVVIGLTLIFSDALNIEEVVEISGQIGRVETIGLRFTTLINIHGQKIYIPNRNITIISRFRKGAIRAYVDIRIPEPENGENLINEIMQIAKGMYHQHKSIILTTPENFGIKENETGKWEYLRIKFRLWPGQESLIESTFRQQIISSLKKRFKDYEDWMVTITYKVE
jgi:small conductance mechanosensitive channel